MHTPTELSTASRRNAKPCCDATGVLAQGGLHLHACVYRSRYWNSHKQTAAAWASMCVRSAHMLLAIKRHTARLRPPWWVSRACIYRHVLSYCTELSRTGWRPLRVQLYRERNTTPRYTHRTSTAYTLPVATSPSSILVVLVGGTSCSTICTWGSRMRAQAQELYSSQLPA